MSEGKTILGFDPGATIGWCVYDPTAGRVLTHGEVVPASEHPCTDAFEDIEQLLVKHGGPVAIERPRIYSGRDKDGHIKHAAGNDVADTCEQAGWLVSMAGGDVHGADLGHGAWDRGGRCYLLERRAVTRELRHHFGEAIVGDGPIWKALVAAHGGAAAIQGPKKGKAATRKTPAEPDREPGHLHGMGGHARAAFATAWALAQLLERKGVKRVRS